MDWQLIIIKIIDGPGAGFTFIILGILATLVALRLMRYDRAVQDAEQRGRESRRSQDLDLLKSQMARLVDVRLVDGG